MELVCKASVPLCRNDARLGSNGEKTVKHNLSMWSKSNNGIQRSPAQSVMLSLLTVIFRNKKMVRSKILNDHMLWCDLHITGAFWFVLTGGLARVCFYFIWLFIWNHVFWISLRAYKRGGASSAAHERCRYNIVVSFFPPWILLFLGISKCTFFSWSAFLSEWNERPLVHFEDKKLFLSCHIIPWSAWLKKQGEKTQLTQSSQMSKKAHNLT